MIALSESPGRISAPVRERRVGGGAWGPRPDEGTSTRGGRHERAHESGAVRWAIWAVMGEASPAHSSSRPAVRPRAEQGITLGGSLHG